MGHPEEDVTLTVMGECKSSIKQRKQVQIRGQTVSGWQKLSTQNQSATCNLYDNMTGSVQPLLCNDKQDISFPGLEEIKYIYQREVKVRFPQWRLQSITEREEKERDNSQIQISVSFFILL